MHRCFQICESDIFTLYSHLLESQSSNLTKVYWRQNTCACILHIYIFFEMINIQRRILLIYKQVKLNEEKKHFFLIYLIYVG